MPSSITYVENLDGNFDPHWEVPARNAQGVINALENLLGAKVTFGRIDYRIPDYFTALAFKFPAEGELSIEPTAYVSIMVLSGTAEESWKKEPRWNVFINSACDTPNWVKTFVEYRDEKFFLEKLRAAIA